MAGARAMLLIRALSVLGIYLAWWRDIFHNIHMVFIADTTHSLQTPKHGWHAFWFRPNDSHQACHFAG